MNPEPWFDLGRAVAYSGHRPRRLVNARAAEGRKGEGEVAVSGDASGAKA